MQLQNCHDFLDLHCESEKTKKTLRYYQYFHKILTDLKNSFTETHSRNLIYNKDINKNPNPTTTHYTTL